MEYYFKTFQSFFITCFLVSFFSCVPANYVEKQQKLENQLARKNSKISRLENYVKDQNRKIQEFAKMIQQMKSQLKQQQAKVSNTIISNENVAKQSEKKNTIVRTSDKRGVYVITIDQHTGHKKEIPLYNKSYAVIIGIDQYKYLPYDMQLNYAVKDAKGVEEVIKKHFCFDEIYTLFNQSATKENIINLLAGKLTSTTEQDSVFIFWSGHGYTEKTSIGGYLGYLIPYDGTFEANQLHKNISMTLIKEDISKRIPAKHIFYVMDSCYSGLLAAKRGSPRKTDRDINYLREITEETSRQVLTAGSVNQQVLDGGPLGHSVFTGRFVELLKNADDYITAHEISATVKEKVFSDARARGHKQTPTYGELFGLGDYVFVPSIIKKAENINDDIQKYQEELQRLNDLEMKAKNANDEREMRQAELKKREIQAKLKAQQLKQERIRIEQEQMRLKEAERINKEQKLIAAEKHRKFQLAALKQQVEDKRKSLGDFTYSSLSPAATIMEMQEIDDKIMAIKEKYRQVLAKSIEMISKQVNDDFVKANKEVQSEFVPEIEFKKRVNKWKNEASSQQSNGFINVKNKIEKEYNKEVKPFIKELNKLSAKEFQLSYQDLMLNIDQYNSEVKIYPVSIKSSNLYNGVLIACSSNIPIPRQEAKIFKQHFKNNILRPEIKGNFQSISFFRVAEAYVIDDATNKKYDLFASKFVEIGDEVVYDSVTNLLWLKNASFFNRSFYYKDAVKACNNLKVHDLAGWRIPTISELKRMETVYKKLENHPFINMRKCYGCTIHSNAYYYCLDTGDSNALSYKQIMGGIGYRSTNFWPVRGQSNP